MVDLLLGPMLRHVTQTSATIWMETDERCEVQILDTTTRTFCVAGRHYALVVVDGLQPGTSTEYDVRLGGALCWPVEGSRLPASRIRTLSEGMSPRVVFGSCRTAAPHTAPWSLEMAISLEGRGVDAVYAYALKMLQQDPAEWPDLAVFLGDQIYADDSSPKTRERIAALRASESHPDDSLPPELVRGFEEFCWLYEESWSPETERWFFSVVPSAMVFDDHDMVDDWNISASWVRDIRTEGWWSDHVIGGLMTYWLYQHLGNLSPDDIHDEGLLDALMAEDDGEHLLRAWATDIEEFTGGRDRYRFSFARDLGPVRLVMIDARNGRRLEPGRRRMVDDAEWKWVVEACRADVEHLLIGSSLPVFVPGGLHDLQVWNAAMCDGRWGRLGARFAERLRRLLDLEDWPAFIRSFDDLVTLIEELGSADRASAPSTISILSGDIHFSYVAQLEFPDDATMASTVHQVVNSPLRNALRPHERMAMRFSMSRFAAGLGRVLRRCIGERRSTLRWHIDEGPVFENCIGRLDFNGQSSTLVLSQASPYDENGAAEMEVVCTTDLRAGAHR